MIWLHWGWVEFASLAVPLVVVGAAMRMAGLSWVWAAVAGAAAAGVTYLAAHELFDVWVRECIAENRTPQPPPSWPWSPRREFCDPGSGPALGGFATLAAPTLVALGAALLARTRLRPVGFALLAVLIPMPLLPELYVSSLPYYRLDEYPILHSPRLLPAGASRPATACYEFGVAFGPKRSAVVRPDDRLTCVELERTAAARSLVPENDGGPSTLELEQLGEELTAKGLPPEPGDTGAHGLVVARAFELPVAELQQRQGAAIKAAVRASYVEPGAPADCRGGLSRHDPPDDVADSRRVLRPDGLPSPDPRADLRALRLRVTGGRVCLAYETKGEVAGPMQFTFELRDSAETDRFEQRFIARLRSDGRVLVWGGGDAPSVPAEVGIGGRVFTLVLDGRSFEEGQAQSSVGSDDPPLGEFGFSATVRTSLAGRRRVRDELGPLILPQAYRYPEGGRCLNEQACPAPARLTAEARRVKPAARRSCARAGGRIMRGVHDPSVLGCVVRYSGVPYDVATRVDRSTVRFQRQTCRMQASDMREIGQEIATARHRPVRVDRFVWHQRTGICETRLKGQLIRPR